MTDELVLITNNNSSAGGGDEGNLAVTDWLNNSDPGAVVELSMFEGTGTIPTVLIYASMVTWNVNGTEDEKWKAFMCYARTFLIPRNIEELDTLTSEDGNVIIPYTVWSNEKGAGKEIINQVLRFIKNIEHNIDRVVTLSPLTKMARKFHLRNNAKEFRVNETTVNFEYEII